MATNYKEGEILMQFREGIVPDQIRSFEEEENLILIQEFSEIRVRHYSLPSWTSVDDAITRFNQHPWVVFAEANVSRNPMSVGLTIQPNINMTTQYDPLSDSYYDDGYGDWTTSSELTATDDWYMGDLTTQKTLDSSGGAPASTDVWSSLFQGISTGLVTGITSGVNKVTDAGTNALIQKINPTTSVNNAALNTVTATPAASASNKNGLLIVGGVAVVGLLLVMLVSRGNK